MNNFLTAVLILSLLAAGDVAAKDDNYIVDINRFFNTLPYRVHVWEVTNPHPSQHLGQTFLSGRQLNSESVSLGSRRYELLSSGISRRNKTCFYRVPTSETAPNPLELQRPDGSSLQGWSTSRPLASSPAEAASISVMMQQYDSSFVEYRKLLEQEEKYRKLFGVRLAAPIALGVGVVLWELIDPGAGLAVGLPGIPLIIHYFVSWAKHKGRQGRLKNLTYRLNHFND